MDPIFLKETLLRAATLIKTGEKHCYYDQVTEYAKEYAAHITGKNIEKYLKRYTIRETDAMFKERVELTNAISPAVSNSLMKPFYKVSRNNNIAKRYDFRNPGINKRIEVMLNDFNSDMMDNTNGLETWLRTRFVELSFTDPNSFVVIEWDAPRTRTETIKPRPFEVSSFDALNYEYRGQVLLWLHVCVKTKYNTIEGGRTKSKDGNRYTHYAQGLTIVYDPIDQAFNDEVGYVLAYNQAYEIISGQKYLVTINETNLNYVPAFKVGYARDLDTNARTYVNPFNPAMPYFRKLLKTTSELDITMSSHAFPQKWQYVQKCNGANPQEPCDNGRCPTRDNAICTACNGTGTMTVKSALEVYYVPLPEDPKEALDLDKMQTYKAPPIDLVKWQDEYSRSMEIRAHMAVYNSNMFVSAEAQIAKTATEIDANMDGIYDAIEPYSEKYSKVWKLIVYTCAALAGFGQDKDDYDLIHAFPADPKLKTLSILLGDLKSVNDSDAPSFTRDIINNDIAEVMFNGDDESLLKYRVRHEFYPFNGKRSEEITMLLSTQYVSDFTKILYSNFESIFSEIEREKDGFYLLPFIKQWEIVQEKVEQWTERILNGTPEAPDKSLLLGGNTQEVPLTNGSNNGEQEPSEPEPANNGEEDPLKK